MANATLKDVAARAGVSVATVSAVVNGASWVTDATRGRVQQAVTALHYRPNRVARSLKTKQAYAVGAIVSDVTSPFFTEIIRGLSHALQETDRHLVLCDADHRFDLADAHLHRLLDQQVDGLVLIGDSVQEASLARHLEQYPSVPVVAIERDYGLDGVSTLLVDSEQGAHDATAHLIEQGYGRIGLIAGPTEGAGSQTHGRATRTEGWRRALAEAGRPHGDDLIARGTFRYESGVEAMDELLRRPPRPDAVFVANDMMALGAMHALRQAGLRIPDDVALVGFDDIPVSALVAPAMSTMAMPTRHLGRAAHEVLQDHLTDGPGYVTVRRTYRASLQVRGSSLARVAATE
ncbi:MAG: LacI family DNA-binding transcriptional regulator [Bacteroidota bacterium]